MFSVGTPPPNDTWHAFLSGLAPSGFPQEDTWRVSPIWTPSGRSTRHSLTSHPNDRHITSGRPTYPIRICLSGSLIKSKQVLLYHSDSLSQPTIRRLQSERTGMMACHLLRSLTAAHRVTMALSPPWSHHDKPKSPPLIKEGERASDTI